MAISPKAIQSFRLLQLQESELEAWTLSQAVALGLDVIGGTYPEELLEATRTTRQHLAALSDEFHDDGSDNRPDWCLS